MTMTMEEGISASYTAADGRLKEIAVEAVDYLALVSDSFTTDEVITYIEQHYGGVENFSFLGGVMRKALSDGIVEFASCQSCGTHRVVSPSVRESQHKKNIPTYQSRVRDQV